MAIQEPRTIQQLTTANIMEAQDYLVISNALTNQDRKIIKSNLIDSIGNPTIDGYTSVGDGANNYTLTPASGNATGEYLNGMTVEFIADMDSTGAVKLRIGGLTLRDMFQLGTATTSTLVAGSYYQATYVGNNAAGTFYQTNVSATELATVTGYTSTSSAVNQITLTPANGVVLDTYYDGMVVEFNSPINSTGLPKLKIGALGERDFFQFGTANTEAPFVTGKHYRATYSLAQNAFYQTNLQAATIFTNEYAAVGTVAFDELSTTYQLTTAKGVTKSEYYNNMSLLFTADIASKGVVFVNVDGLGNKVLGEGDQDPVANNLYAGQPLLAIYNGVDFIKHRFATTNPPAPPIDPDEPIPDENLVVINVGPTRPIKKIQEAITALIEEFGDDGGNRLATINLDDAFVWEDRVLIQKIDYSWITIINSTNINITNSGIATMTVFAPAVSPVISGTYTITSGSLSSVFAGGNGSVYNFTDATFFGPTSSRLIQGHHVNANNLNTTGMEVMGAPNNAGANIELNNCTFTEFTQSVFGPFTRQCNFVMRQCYISSTVNSYLSGVIVLSTRTTFDFSDCTVTGVAGFRLLLIEKLAEGSLTNCRFISRSNSQIGVEAGASSTILIDGGDYRTLDNTVYIENILAQSGSIITLVNSPLGGASASTGGQIITT